MHLSEGSLDTEVLFGGVGMRCHNSNYRGVIRIISWCNDSKNDILTGEYSRDTLSIHDQYSRRVMFLHQARRFADCSADIDEDGRWSCCENGREIWAGHFCTEVRKVLEHLLWLGAHAAPLCLYALEGFVQFFGRCISTFELP